MVICQIVGHVSDFVMCSDCGSCDQIVGHVIRLGITLCGCGSCDGAVRHMIRLCIM